MAGLYVHVPFCARACPYCDFDFQVGRHPDAAGFIAGLARELAARKDMSPETGVIPPGAAWPTVYLGGGTPSLLGPAGLRELAAWIDRHFPGAGHDEYTVEVNPEHASPELFAAIAGFGATRVSLGVQTLDPAGLTALGRAHDRAAALAALTDARAAGLEISADLIVGWPGQTAASLRADVAAIVAAGARHVSVYALTIESGTPWETLVRRGKRRLPDPEHQTDLLILAADTLVAAGLEHYEVASYAAPGQHARHNLGYWTWRDYLGL
ncbi:MAG: coproporphyrinogen III oxidase family protein, partial [Myxococcales bacterium]|nr:coproporphyrinogen III oxidase family protein [Myxococcales bacterium]